jgi:hypothetical protein
MSRCKIFRWSRYFKKGNKNTVDDTHCDAPCTASTDISTKKANEILVQDKRVTLLGLTAGLNMALKQIISVKLGMFQVCATWITAKTKKECTQKSASEM